MASSNWAQTQLSKILALDEESLKQIIEYSSTLSPEAAAENFKNLLGDSPQALDFISSFNSRRHVSSAPSSSQTGTSNPGTFTPGTGSSTPPRRGKKKANLKKLPPPRRPDDYGNTQGAYHKKDDAEEYMPSSSSRLAPPSNTRNTFSLASTPAATSNTLSPSMPNIHTRTASPKPTRTATPPNPTKSHKVTIAGGQPMHGASTALSDLDSALRALELTTNPSHASAPPEVRRCPCMATIHPLLAAAPNCLNCGKIVCAKEGLAPCTFCGTPLLSPQQTQAMIAALRTERGEERMKANNAGQKRAEVSTTSRAFQASNPTPGNKSGPVLGADTRALEMAQAHRDRLLGFQASNAARTKVVDEAAAFETPEGGVSQWGSAEARAAQLKSQQRVLREMEWNARPEYEKRRMVVSVDLVGGKVVKRMGKVDKPDFGVGGADGENEAEERIGEETGTGVREGQKGGAFSKNPLLGNLIRPTWKPEGTTDVGEVTLNTNSGGKGKDVEGVPKRERNTPWRRVQDDSNDNEEYILNGGAYGGRENGEEPERG